MTIIQVAGTSGSGKSHLMRAFLQWTAEKNGGLPFKEHAEGRATPIGYLIRLQGVEAPVYVCGAYEVPTGGCDTIHNIEQVYEMVWKAHKKGQHVLYEGLFCMNMTRGPQLAAKVGKDYCVLQLTTPLVQCIAAINVRRAARGEGELINKKNTIDNYKRAENFCSRMRDAGARVFRVNRDEALGKMLELLGAVQAAKTEK